MPNFVFAESPMDMILTDRSLLSVDPMAKTSAALATELKEDELRNVSGGSWCACYCPPRGYWDHN
jgi:hypothetical protein